MDQLQAENANRTSSKRKKPEKVVVSVSEPDAVPGRDKLKTFRLLYNVQLMYDLDSAFVTAYDLFARQNDPGTIGPMLDRSVELAGKKPGIVLGDSAYAGGPDLALCEQAGVTVYAPVSENDFSEAKAKKGKKSQLPKKEFTWLPEEQTYRCPEGHLWGTCRTTRLERSSERTVLQTTYRCSSEHCRACPRREACTPSSQRGRSISRLEHQDLVDELRARMETPEAKALYKLRRQTIELRYADMKEHRHLRRFHHYGVRRARAQIGGSGSGLQFDGVVEKPENPTNPGRAYANSRGSPFLKGGWTLNGPPEKNSFGCLPTRHKCRAEDRLRRKGS